MFLSLIFFFFFVTWHQWLVLIKWQVGKDVVMHLSNGLKAYFNEKFKPLRGFALPGTFFFVGGVLLNTSHF